ncbi:hypothetical protein EOA32_00845 [Mesorhizobium sp. M1A.F.Ca.ET.072.01.1.1]|uniref:hypothetical protein n=1 Tax=Mesorhizobium sp. M1A.F.Ca.ET.072.01.1.1 TaxID=2496753 RepID=UPI000FD2B3AF|nr:hypothetical protein [Mesorhizobium sp. M1A.F.Ca.ET.072.01.1.1]RUW55599.1 hypothetical protein EOA32_00845 [Mesorhizobium sp. M1A.F.Ca.ET.072.01.1.1]
MSAFRLSDAFSLSTGLSPAEAAAFVPSNLFPSNLATIDLDYVNDQYAINGTPGAYLPDGSNTDDGRLLRGQIAPAQPSYVEKADGSLKTYTSTLATVRRSDLFGIYCGVDITNVCLQSRSFNNASWAVVGANAPTKNQIGRTGVANSCCEVVLTATTATLTMAIASTDSTARDRIGSIEWKQTFGSGGTCSVSLDAGASFPAQTTKAIAGANARSFKKTRFDAVQNIAGPQTQIKLTGSIGDKFVLDFAECLDTGATNPADVVLYEQPPIQTTTASFKVWRDRPAAAVAGYAGTTQSSPMALFERDQAVQVHYFEFWQRRDGALVASSAGLQVSSNQTAGCTAFGLKTFNGGAGVKPVYTTDLRSPIRNKLLIGQKATEAFLCLNGTMVTGAGGSSVSASDHFDENTNGNGDSRICGGSFRRWMGTDYDHAKASAVAFTS